MLKYREAFNPESAAAYTRKRHEQEVKQLTRRAQKLGYTLIPADASLLVSVPKPLLTSSTITYMNGGLARSLLPTPNTRITQKAALCIVSMPWD